MSYFRFGTFPRPPRWNYWNPAMMIPSVGPKTDPKPGPELPEEEDNQIPFIPPPLSDSVKEEEEEEEEDQHHRQQQQQHHQHHQQQQLQHHQQKQQPQHPQQPQQHHHQRQQHQQQHQPEHHDQHEHEERDRERVIRSTKEERGITHRLLRLKAYRYRGSKDSWKHLSTPGTHISARMDDEERRRLGRCSEVRIITWNVDMATERSEERLTEALRYIQHAVLRCKHDDTEPEPCVIMLQEVRDSLVPFLLRDEWVRSWFVVTPFTKDKWPEGAYYGNVTLVSRMVAIAEAHILHFGLSKMQRTAVCVKIRLDVPGTEDRVVMAIVNTHLESMPQGAQARPDQLEMCARFLTLEGVAGGVVAGDMNAIGPDDATLPRKVGLKDSWRKGDDVDEGKTWGYQGQNQANHPCGRLDKILFLRGSAGYKVDEPKRFGVGLKTADDGLWVSDHYGLETTLRVLKPRMTSSR